jgi:uncharacterized membrane-anchored protein
MEAMMAPFLKLPVRHRGRPEDLPGVIGRARLDRRTKQLTRRAGPGDIAIIDHADLDKVSADALIGLRVAAVVNVAPSISGRYPNTGPQALIEAGIPLLDNVGPEVFGRVSEGMWVRLDGAELYAGGEVVAKGQVQTAGTVSRAMKEAKDGIAVQLAAFVTNTLEYVKGEGALLTDGIPFPDLRTPIEGRHVLVVVRGHQYREDLLTLRSYIREFKPVMVGVDGGADALLEAGYRPDVIVGDMDSVTDEGLHCGAELVVHAYLDGRAPGLARIERLGLPALLCPAGGTSEDVALLMADEKGATLIVAVGTHNSLDDVLDKGRPGYASTWLTRLRVGSKLVDAKGVSRLYRDRISGWALLGLVLAACATILVVLSASPAGQAAGHIFLTYLGAQWDGVKYWLSGLF